MQHEFGRANAAEDTGSPVAPLDKHPAFVVWSALNIGSQQQMWRALGDMVSRQATALDGAYSEGWVTEFKAKHFPTLVSFINA